MSHPFIQVAPDLWTVLALEIRWEALTLYCNNSSQFSVCWGTELFQLHNLRRALVDRPSILVLGTLWPIQPPKKVEPFAAPSGHLPVVDKCCSLAFPTQESKYPHWNQGVYFNSSISHLHPSPQRTSVLFKDVHCPSSVYLYAEPDQELFVIVGEGKWEKQDRAGVGS